MNSPTWEDHGVDGRPSGRAGVRGWKREGSEVSQYFHIMTRGNSSPEYCRVHVTMSIQRRRLVTSKSKMSLLCCLWLSSVGSVFLLESRLDPRGLGGRWNGSSVNTIFPYVNEIPSVSMDPRLESSLESKRGIGRPNGGSSKDWWNSEPKE